MNNEIKTRLAQIRAGEIPQGYKKTKLGIIPQEWEVMPLKSRFDRLTRKNSENNTNVMTISAQYGLINQGEFFKKEIASEDKSNYYLLHNGEFAYNKSYSSGYPFGAIKRLSLYDKGIVSPLYICFSANNNNSCPEFYQHYFESGKLNSEIQAIAQEGARNHGLLNISVEDFFYTKIIVPPLEEQKKIADILSAQDRIIELCERKTEQLKHMKKYYLQKMFPKDGEEYPEIRFKGFTDPWEQRKVAEMFKITRGYVLAAPLTDENPSDAKPYPVYSSQTKDNGLMGYYKDYLYENAITWTTDGANAGTVNYRGGKFYCTNVCGVLLADKVTPNQMIAEALNNVAKGHVSYVGNPKLMNNVMAEITISLPTSEKEREVISAFFDQIDNLITLNQRKCEEEKKKKNALQQLLLTGIVRV